MELFLKSFAAAFFSAQRTGPRLMTDAENKIEYFLCTVVTAVILTGAAVGAGALAGRHMPIYAAGSAAAVIFSCLACTAALGRNKNRARESAISATPKFFDPTAYGKALISTAVLSSGCRDGDLKALLGIYAGCLTALICASSYSSLVKEPHDGTRAVISFAVFALIAAAEAYDAAGYFFCSAAARTTACTAFDVWLCTVCFIKSRKNERKKLPVFRYG